MLRKIQHVHFVGIGGSGMSGIAEVLIEHLDDKSEIIARTEIAGPGFINFHLSAQAFHAELARTLDRLADEFTTRHISLLKIDVEGHEREVLAGASSRPLRRSRMAMIEPTTRATPASITSQPRRSVHWRAAAAGATIMALISTTPTVCRPITMATTSSAVSTTCLSTSAKLPAW